MPHRHRDRPGRNRTATLVLLAGVLIASVGAGAQVANDDCAADVPLLTVSTGAELVYQAVSTVGATRSRATACADVSVDDDVFYRFVATAPALELAFRNLVATQGERSGIGYAIYAACGGRQLACRTRFGRDATAGATAAGLSAPLTPGETYYLQTYIGGEDNEGTFELALRGVGSTAPNDFCGEGLPLLPTGGDGAPAFTSVSTAGATQGPGTACSQTWLNDDVWYRFVAAGDHLRIGFRDLRTERGEVSGVGYAIYAACDGAALECVGRFGESRTAATDRPVLREDLVAGETYLLRVWTGGADNAGAFDLSLESFDAAAANDECAGAQDIGIAFERDSTEVVPVYTVGATASVGGDCLAADRDDDVWFEFEAISENLIVSYRKFRPARPDAAGVGYVLTEACGGDVLACGRVPVVVDGTGIKFANPRPGLVPGQRYRLGLFVLGGGGGAFEARVRGSDLPRIAALPTDGACVEATAIADGSGGTPVRLLDPEGGIIASFLNDQDLGRVTATFGRIGEGALATVGDDGVPYLGRHLTIASERPPRRGTRLALYVPFAEIDSLFAATGRRSFLDYDFARRDSTPCATPFDGRGEAYAVNARLDYPGGWFVQARVDAFGEFFMVPENTLVAAAPSTPPPTALRVHPNPSSAGHVVYLEVDRRISDRTDPILITDALGRAVSAATVRPLATGYAVTGLAAGVYAVSVRDGGRVASARVIVR